MSFTSGWKWKLRHRLPFYRKWTQQASGAEDRSPPVQKGEPALGTQDWRWGLSIEALFWFYRPRGNVRGPQDRATCCPQF